MRENVIRLVVVGLLGAGAQPCLAKSNPNCEKSLGRRTAKSAAKKEAAKIAVAEEAAPVKVNPEELLQKLLATVHLSRKANDLGFDFNVSPTRSITREEAQPIVAMMIRMKKLDAAQVAEDIAGIQLYGHFDRLFDIDTILASAYSSNMDPKPFARKIAEVQANVMVPNSSELGFQATDLRRPDISEAIMVFNVIVLNKGDGRAAQEAIVNVADALNTGEIQAIVSVIFQAQSQKLPAVELAKTVSEFASQIKLSRRVLGFGAQTEDVLPTAMEAIQLLQIAGQLKMPTLTLIKVIAEVQQQTDAKDFATIINALADTLEEAKSGGQLAAK